jgi:hypothetical protein
MSTKSPHREFSVDRPGGVRQNDFSIPRSFITRMGEDDLAHRIALVEVHPPARHEHGFFSRKARRPTPPHGRPRSHAGSEGSAPTPGAAPALSAPAPPTAPDPNTSAIVGEIAIRRRTNRAAWCSFLIMIVPGFAWTVRLRRPSAGEDERQAKPDFVWTVHLAAFGGKTNGPGEAWSSCCLGRHGVQSRRHLALGEADLPVLGVYDDLIALGELPL